MKVTRKQLELVYSMAELDPLTDDAYRAFTLIQANKRFKKEIERIKDQIKKNEEEIERIGYAK